MEPGVVVIRRGVEQDDPPAHFKEPLQIDTTITERRPGDGMEASVVQQPPSAEASKSQQPPDVNTNSLLQFPPQSPHRKSVAVVQQPSPLSRTAPTPSILNKSMPSPPLLNKSMPSPPLLNKSMPSPPLLNKSLPSPTLLIKAPSSVHRSTPPSGSPQLQRKTSRKPNEIPPSMSMDDLAAVVRAESPDLQLSNLDNSEANLTMIVDSLKTQLSVSEKHNSQLIEEKMRLSHQLGVQTQVNNELKRLLVASIGDDMEAKYERMLHDKYLADLELQHLHSVLDEDREEVEQAMIQADVWRSKFLASRVMSDELSRWKSVLYYKYRETHTALQSLLEEHSKIRALNNATRVGLVKVVDLLGCKDPSLDVDKSLSTLDVAYMNNDLASSISEVMALKMEEGEPEQDREQNAGAGDATSESSASCVLTSAENAAQHVVLNPGIENEELSRMRRDYLSHNRISHFLSTNYQA